MVFIVIVLSYPASALAEGNKQVVDVLRVDLQSIAIRLQDGFGAPHHISMGIASWQHYCMAVK